MIAGRRLWIVVWYGILLLGVLGLWASIYWGRQTRWKNIDELLRAVGTIVASMGMLLLLHGVGAAAGQAFLVVALLLFALAFIVGRRPRLPAEKPRGPRAMDSAPPNGGSRDASA
ncbi:MAG: hypothetical protein ACRENB_04180 [Gemmatimonadales bacterium]